MQRREFDCATIGVANRTDISGSATADEIDRGFRTGKERIIGRIASLTFLGSLMVAGLFVAVVPLPARADNDEDARHGREENEKGIRAEIAALKAQVADLQNQVNSLQTSNTTLQNQLAAVQSNPALALGPFVSVDPNPEIGVIGPNIIFSGANIHIVSGSGMTNDNGNPRGLGNLIIGYDEDPIILISGGPGGGFFPPNGFPLSPGDRGGSHNLVIGKFHRFTRAAFGGLVAGELNKISDEAASVSGGRDNVASGADASVSGGFSNTASGPFASVSGGVFNTASGFEATVNGGESNTASGRQAIVSGGSGNTAGGTGTVVIGGQNVTDNNNNSIAPQPPFP